MANRCDTDGERQYHGLSHFLLSPAGFRSHFLDKGGAIMPLTMVVRTVNFAFAHTPGDETIDIGFFSG